MKRGSLYVDGNDLYLTYGIFVTEGGWNELIAFPPLKTVDKNEWYEEDGEEADLSNPVLNTKEVQISFAVSGVYSRFEEFVDMLSDGAYHTFECAAIKRNFTLRLTSQPNSKLYYALGFVTMKFANDYPLKGYEYEAPVSSVMSCDDFTLDGHLFTEYGAMVLQGAISEIKKTATVKPNLLRNYKYTSGALYDGRNVFFKSKDVKLSILMRAETLEELWRNYDALLFDLIRPDERILWVNSMEAEFPCYYKSCTVSNFFPTGKIWLDFTITLTFTRDFRITVSDTLLSSEDGIIIITDTTELPVDMLLDKYTIPTMRLVNNRQTMRFTSNKKLRFNN